MTQLSITTNWSPAELCINVISDAIKIEMESRRLTSREILEYVFIDISSDDVTMEDIWYGTYDHLVHEEDWTRGKNIADYTGPLFVNLNEVRQVFLNTHESKKIDIDVEDCDYGTGSTSTKMVFKKMTALKLKRHEVAVYHGGISGIDMSFNLEFDEPFNESELVFNFVDCGKYGIILNKITYNNVELEKDYSPFKKIYFDLDFIDF